MRRRWQLKLLGMAVVIPLFLGAVLPEHVRTLVCRFTGIAMPEEACCPQGADQEVDASSRLRSESCCVVKTADLVRLISERQAEATPPGYPSLVGYTTVTTASALPARRFHAAYRRGPPPGPPIVLAKHAFLI